MKKIELKIKKSNIHTSDNVQIMLGKDRGKTGKVLRVWTKESKVLVEGINMYKRHVKKTAQHEGGILDIPKSINISNAMIVCPECKKITRVGIKVEANSKIRICKKCKKEIVIKKEKK